MTLPFPVQRHPVNMAGHTETPDGPGIDRRIESVTQSLGRSAWPPWRPWRKRNQLPANFGPIYRSGGLQRTRGRA